MNYRHTLDTPKVALMTSPADPTSNRNTHTGASLAIASIVRAGMMSASIMIAQNGTAGQPGDPNLRRHWAPAFDIALPEGVSSDDLKGRCWAQPALDTYVTEGRLWIEDIYGLPYGYVDRHCLREQLSKMNAALNASYRTLLRSVGAAERHRVIASERRWIIRRNGNCGVPDGIGYITLGSFVCLMNMTSDRLEWIATWKADRPAE